MGPLTERMLDLAGVGPGSRVLDVAAGTGEQTLLAAQRVGPGGCVLATDISAEMLAVAAEQAHAAEVANVETLVADAHLLALQRSSFDAAICRSGLMLMADPVTVLRRIRHALKAGGRLSTLVFGAAEANSLQWLPTRIAREAAGLPPPAVGEPGMFSLGADGHLAEAFEAAGFVHVSVQAVATSRRFESAAAASRSLRDMLPSVHAILRRVDEDERQRAWIEIEGALRALEGPGGLLAPGEMLLGTGTA